MKLMVLLFFSYIAVFSLAQLTRIPPQSTNLSEVHFYITDVIVALIAGVWLIYKIRNKENFIYPLGRPIVLFILVCFISLVVNIQDLSLKHIGISSLYLIRWIVYSCLYFVAYDFQKFKKMSVSDTLIAAGIFSALLGLLQYVFLPDTRFLEKFGWDPHYYRLIGTFFDPGYLGIILVLTLILLTVKIWAKKNNLLIFLWLIVYLALAFTYSRASYLGYLGGFFVLSWMKKRPKFYLGIIGMLTVTILLLPRPGGEGVRLERDSTIKFRIINWGHAIEIIKDHPVLGVGFNCYRYAQEKYGYIEERINEVESHSGAGVDSSILFVLATTGIFGLVLYLWMLKEIFKTKEIIVLASGVALIVHSLFTNTLFYPWIMGWFWIIIGAYQKKQSGEST